MNNMTKSDLKERERQTWASVAQGWRRRDELLRQGSAPVTERMLELAGIDTGHRVLDIASGTGEPAISAAQRAGATGRVIGTDLVEDMLEFAREKAAAAQLNNIEFRCVDGEAIDLEASSMDAVTIRWGLMFMPDPEVCLQHAYRALKAGGRLVAACWAAPERNPFVSLLVRTLANYMEVPKPPAGAPGIFAFADPDRLRAVFASAGFVEFHIEDMEINVIQADSGAAYWAAMEDLAGPVTMLVNRLDPDRRAAYVAEVIAAADHLMASGTLPARGTTWIVSGRRPA